MLLSFTCDLDFVEYSVFEEFEWKQVRGTFKPTQLRDDLIFE